MSMATFSWDSGNYEAMLSRLQGETDNIIKKMLKEGAKITAAHLTIAAYEFAKYWKIKAPRKNQWGWYAKVLLKGTTSSGAPAALAANVYEYGRKDESQPARPFIRSTIKEIEQGVYDTMQAVYDEEARKLSTS
jgi:hypothetical protein